MKEIQLLKSLKTINFDKVFESWSIYQIDNEVIYLSNKETLEYIHNPKTLEKVDISENVKEMKEKEVMNFIPIDVTNLPKANLY